MKARTLVPNPRQAALLQAVRDQGSASVEALAHRFHVTLQTVRRDVRWLVPDALLAKPSTLAPYRLSGK